ncbi:MAG TPA: EamA family transporter RarD, partial [Nevskiaceae bacterium]|nr:EamA family transporter RarD [Nevskiaceae bacterium]
MQQGLLAAAAAYFIWGLFPIYWRYLVEVPSLQIMAHRIVWCALLVFAYLFARDGRAWLARFNRKLLLMLSGSSLLIAVNWWLYIWAVNHGHIVETSLGYFINPLVSVLLGVFLLGERLNTTQRVAVVIAAGGVLYLTWSAGHPPLIALALAFSFGGYGLIRKLAVVPSIEGLAVESGLLFIPALLLLLLCEHDGSGVFGHASTRTNVLLVL